VVSFPLRCFHIYIFRVREGAANTQVLISRSIVEGRCAFSGVWGIEYCRLISHFKCGENKLFTAVVFYTLVRAHQRTNTDKHTRIRAYTHPHSRSLQVLTLKRTYNHAHTIDTRGADCQKQSAKKF